MQLLSLSCVICISGEPRRCTRSKGGGVRETKGETERSEETEAESLRRERRRRQGANAATLNSVCRREIRRDGGVRYGAGP